MTRAKRFARWTQDRINYACIMMEGLFNTLGHDIIGATTIIPLFMADLGASLGVIGGLSTMRSVIGAIAPFLFGGVVAAAKSKRNLSILVNGIGRGIILLVPILLVMGVTGNAMIGIFFAIMFVFNLGQPITGISWNYLLGNCVSADRRGKLLGTLFGVSGLITFFSSMIIKAIRSSPTLSTMGQYTVIFAFGGVMMVASVLCYLPLKEEKVHVTPKEDRNIRAYVTSLLQSFKNRDYNWAIATNAFSSISSAVNTFFFIFAQNTLLLSTSQVSNLLIVQTVGIMLGGFTTGRVSSRFGIKRMLTACEALGILVPVLGLVALSGSGAYLCAAIAVFVMGFARSGSVGYQAYILEVVDESRSIYAIVAKSMALLPFSFVSVAVGSFLQAYPVGPVFVFQIVICALAVLCATRLRLTVYPRDKEKEGIPA